MELADKMNNISIQETANKKDMQRTKQTKRMDYIEWKDYFMATAFLAAQRSKDPKCQVGACLVNKENIIVGVGYNGMPNGCSDDEFPWGTKTENKLDDKHLYVCHAEMNAITNRNCADVKDCTIYVSLFPCNECSKIIIQSGIKNIVYFSDEKCHKPKYIAAKRMLEAAKVDFKQYIPKMKQVVINFTTQGFEEQDGPSPSLKSIKNPT